MKKDDTITTEIDIHPLSVNQCFRRGKSMGLYKSSIYKEYERELLLRLPKFEMIKGRIGVSLVFYLKHPARNDLDNLLKPIIDILGKKKYFANDNDIYFLECQKYQRDNEGIKIAIYEL